MMRPVYKAMKSGICSALAVVLLSFLPVRAVYSQTAADTAGDTRAGTVALQQADKSTKVKPPEPDKVEAYFQRVERIFLEDPSGFYPYFASVYHGGGLTLGAGYRKFYGDNTFWNIQGL